MEKSFPSNINMVENLHFVLGVGFYINDLHSDFVSLRPRSHSGALPVQ